MSTTASPFNPLTNIVTGLSLSGIPLHDDCGNATNIASTTEELLLGCMVCPVQVTNPDTQAVVITEGKLMEGVVGAKMKCNPKGAFCYTQKIDNKCDNSVNQKFKNFDVTLYSEFETDTLLKLFLQSIETDPKHSNILNDTTLAAALLLLAKSGISPELISLLAALFASLGVPVDENCSECPSIDLVQLKLSLLARFRIINKLQMLINGSAYNAKEAEGQLDHSVQISWDFCSVPHIKPCCPGGTKHDRDRDHDHEHDCKREHKRDNEHEHKRDNGYDCKREQKRDNEHEHKRDNGYDCKREQKRDNEHEHKRDNGYDCKREHKRGHDRDHVHSPVASPVSSPSPVSFSGSFPGSISSP
jgi:hypothetical protein